MSKKQKLFKSKELRDLKSMAQVLRSIADKVEMGELYLRETDEEFHIILPPEVIFEFEVKEKVKKHALQHQIELEIKWYDGCEISSHLIVE